MRGFSSFYPDKLVGNKYIAPVYLTDFQIFNKRVSVADKNSVLEKHISETKEITISYDQSVISFEFAALNYTMSEKINMPIS